jgi:transglutaminase-like putative cysteine protease
MFGKTADYFRKLSTPKRIEDSRGFRVSVWASVSISFFTLAIQGVTSPSLIAVAILMVSLGSYTSWRRRYKRNTLIKLLVAALSLAALVAFLRQAYQQPYDLRISLAELFAWIQVMHSFDLPRRRDLLFSLVSSLVLVSLAGSFALSASFVWLVLPWLAAALASLYYSQLSRLRDLSATPQKAVLSYPSLGRLASVIVMLIVFVSGMGLAIGAAIPRPSMSLMQSLPFSLRRAFNPLGDFKFENPGYPDLPLKPPDSALEINPEAYFGFSPFLDLRVRGQLADLPVMKVRASEPAYWGGLYFQEYDGTSWLTGEEEPYLLNAFVQPFELSYDQAEDHLASHTVIQTFYIQSEQPNVIFAAFRPRLVYFPSSYIYQGYSGLKSPYQLTDDLVYSIVSDRIVPGDLRISSSMEAESSQFAPYLEVPSLPERVYGLSSSLTDNVRGPYGRALAIEAYLKENYAYSLDIPPLPSGQDAVDFFLFDSRSGYCEHFASAYAILCRLSGIPSRVVTGYSTGDFNPFSGLYEVSLDDAHAWVEIYLEGIGWVTVEPTPSFSLPDPGEGSGSLWIFGDFLSWLGGRLASLIPPSLRSTLKSALAAIASAAIAFASGLAYSVRQAPWLPILLLAVLLLLPILLYTRRRRRSPTPPSSELDGAVTAMRDFMKSLEPLGLKREPAQTLGEYAARLYMLVPGLDLSTEFSLFERARYGLEPLRPEDLSRLRIGLTEALDIMRLRIRSHRRFKRPPGQPR